MRRKLFACAAAVLVGAGACEDVIGPIGDPVDLSYAPCVGAVDNPTWFAFQDGDGSWERVNASTSGSYDFALSSGRGGVAMVTPEGGLFVVYATTEEFQANFPSCNGAVRTVSGTATGFTSAENIRLTMGSQVDEIFGATAPASFAIPTVDATVNDLVAVRYQTSVTTAGVYEAFPSNVFIRRDVSGSTTGTVDFNSTTEAGAPVQRELLVTNVSTGEGLTVLSNLGLSNTLANVAVYESPSTFTSGAATAPFYGVPAARLQSGESQMVFVGAAKSTNTTDESRFSTFTFTSPVSQSVTLGPSLGSVTVSGSARPSASYTVQAAYDNLYDVVFSQNNGSVSRLVEVLATNAYLGGPSSVTLAVPDLSGVSGFSSTWLLVPGVAGTWSFLATDADLAILNSKPITYQGADRTAGFTP